MGQKSELLNALRKAKEAGDQDEIERLEAEIAALQAERSEAATEKAQERAKEKSGYVVQAGDSWEKIAEELYGDQRYAGLLMEANGGYWMLQPGDVLIAPEFDIAEGTSPYYSPALFAQSSGPPSLTPDQIEDILARTLADDLAELGLGLEPTTQSLPQTSSEVESGLTPEETAFLGAAFVEEDINELAAMMADMLESLGLVPPEGVQPL